MCLLQKQGSIPVDAYRVAAVTIVGVYLPEGVPSCSGTCPGGVLAWEGELPARGVYLPREEYLPRGVRIPACNEEETPPTPHEQND